MALYTTGIFTLILAAKPQDPPAATDTAFPVEHRALRIEVGTGYDFFTHNYTVLSVDTASTLSEGNAHLNLIYSPFTGTDRTVEIGERFFVGRQYTYNTLSAYWREGGWQGLNGSAQVRWESKRFSTDGLLFSNDHDALQGSVRGAYHWPGQWSVRGRLRGEVFDYERHSSFFYDTRTWDGAVAVRGGDWIGPYWELETGAGTQAVPDSTVLDRSDRDLRLTLGWSFTNGGELQTVLYGASRHYGEDGPRPDRSLYGLEVTARLAPLQLWGTWLEARLERHRYAEQTLVYNDGTDGRLLAGPAWRPSDEWEVRIGAGYQWHGSETFTDTTYVDLFGVTQLVDSYTQPFLFAETNIFTSAGLWAFVSVEVGQRRYKEQTDWDSDFLYVDLGATAEIPLGKGVALQAMVNVMPERHREPEDNSVTNYTSIDLLWRF